MVSEPDASPRVLCIGDLMLDVVALLESEIHFGGDTQSRISTHGGGAAANVATWLGSLGVSTWLTAKVGEDFAGQGLLRELDSFQVEYASDISTNVATGTVIVLVDHQGERSMFPDWGANSALRLKDLPRLDGFSIAYLSGYSLINSNIRSEVKAMIEHIRSHSLPIIFDPSTVGALMEVGLVEAQSWLAHMDILTLNEEEAHFLAQSSDTRDSLHKLLEFCPLVIIKRGAEGVIAARRGEGFLTKPALSTNVIDTTGAGDSFAAGFISSWIASQDLEQSLTKGTEVAAQCVALIGARPLVGAH